ncbi:inactive protein RESTRICTED TEV MOVEMENT 2-like [Lycium ferocissimum]|uniref:inactive protein RESTRICTED TEV MOVEMENT 2-like n=1 Tax=Lycium ferocissimum TaxID=112874 RepID=UPI002815B8F3|nr:inactive protein RESTRICTED TEV MOVEMENT 2-like [Lycium ferocissimum]
MGNTVYAPLQVFEDFEPTTELVREQDSDTLLLYLTGFKKEEVRVELTRTGIMKISGERPVGFTTDGNFLYLRFQEHLPLSENCDNTKISTEFENGILYI